MERPKIDKQIIEKAAKLTASQASNIDPNDVDDLAKDISRAYIPHMDGYRLAKMMDDFGWDVDSMFVEDMDVMWNNVRIIHDEAQRVWAKDKNIQPPYPIGTKTTRGEIVGIYEHGAAQYLIVPTNHDDIKNGYRRLIVNFEDVVLDQ